MTDKKARNLKYANRQFIISTVMVILCTGLNILCLWSASLLGEEFASIVCCLGSFLVAGTCGYMPGMLVSLFTALSLAGVQEDYLYYGFTFLLMSALISSFSKKGWFKKGRLGIQVFVLFIMSVLAGPFNGLILILIDGRAALDGWDIMSEFIWTLPMVFVSELVLFFFINYSPRRLFIYYPYSRYYMDWVEIQKVRSEPLSLNSRKRSLSTKVTMLIGLISFVLCASAMVLSNYLYSDLALTFMHERGVLSDIENPSRNGIPNDAPNTPDGEPGDIPDEGAGPGPGVSDLNSENESTASSQGMVPGAFTENGEVVLNGIIMGDGVFDPSEFEDRGARARMAFDIRRNLVFDFKLLTLLAMIAFLVSHLANLYAQKRIAEPINKIASAMNSFAFGLDNEREENEKKIHELNIRTGDEIELLYKAVDKTVSEVTDYLRRFKEEQRLENELKVAKAASEAKSGFLSNMSHEIRTPINAVLGMDEMILRECKDPQILEYAHDLRDAGKTLLGLVNDILDFSKIEAGKLEILPVEYDLSSVINDLVNMNMVRMETKGLEFNVHVDEKIPHILYGDEIRIKQVVLNILSNAAKYTEKGSVDFSVKLDHREQDKVWLHFDVRDTGIGIKEEDIDKLFKPFERIEEKRNRTIEGTGLGMNIVTQLLTLMDSSLKVKSVYGEGSDFSFTLEQKIVDETPIGNFEERLKNAHQGEKQYHESFRAPSARVLVVDDTPMNLTVVRGYLKKTKLHIDTAESGYKCLDLIRVNKYDCIFLDHRMPEMDGVETHRRMKNLEGNLNEDTPVVALTANAVSGAREEYMAEGFTDYLSKPIDGLKLEETLMRLIPEEKLEKYEEEDEVADSEEADDEQEEFADDSGIPDVEGTNRKEALKACGSADVLDQVLRQFATTIDLKADKIEKLFNEGDIENYTIEVHALKSSARLIGAMELSALALELEEAGNNNDIPKIKAKTPALLYDYRAYKQALKDFKDDEDAGDDREEMGEEEFREGLSDLKEAVTAFDFDSADLFIEEFEKYKIPAKYKDDYSRLKVLISEVASDDIINLIDGILN